MSNRTSRLNALADSMRRLGLHPARVPTSVDVVRADGTLEQLEAVVSSDRRTQDVRRASEMADFTGVPMGVYADRAGDTIVAQMADAPRADRWTLVARCEPRTL